MKLRISKKFILLFIFLLSKNISFSKEVYDECSIIRNEFVSIPDTVFTSFYDYNNKHSLYFTDIICPICISSEQFVNKIIKIGDVSQINKRIQSVEYLFFFIGVNKYINDREYEIKSILSKKNDVEIYNFLYVSNAIYLELFDDLGNDSIFIPAWIKSGQSDKITRIYKSLIYDLSNGIKSDLLSNVVNIAYSKKYLMSILNQTQLELDCIKVNSEFNLLPDSLLLKFLNPQIVMKEREWYIISNNDRVSLFNYYDIILSSTCISPDIFVDKIIRIGENHVENEFKLLGDNYSLFMSACYSYETKHQNEIVDILSTKNDNEIFNYLYALHCTKKFTYIPSDLSNGKKYIYGKDHNNKRLQKIYLDLISYLNKK